MEHQSQLKKTLGPVLLWGLGVGYVISGEYFGWNLGLSKGGTYGMLAAFTLVTVMYVTFVFSYTEMACAIPRAGGVFVYSGRSMGNGAAYLGGIAQTVEFVFAPPAIAMAIGGYAKLWLPADMQSVVVVKSIAVAAYLIFTGLNIWGVRQAATFELVVTILAVIGLVLFSAVAIPHFRWENFSANAWPHGWSGAFAALPFAIWFYLAIEGVANAAEEAVDPQRDVSRGFGAAIVTLVVLACCAFFLSVGIGGWERVVYQPGDLTVVNETIVVAENAAELDSPLPLALEQIIGSSSPLYHLLVGIGLLGLFASFNGIILASGRAVFEMGRARFFFKQLGYSHPRTQTPVLALVVNMLIGVVAILFFDTTGLITMAAFGAVTLYIVSMIALIRLRQKEPHLKRPFMTPLYPFFPIAALLIALVCLVAMTMLNINYENPWRSYSLWYYGYLVLAFLYYFAIRHKLASRDTHFGDVD